MNTASTIYRQSLNSFTLIIFLFFSALCGPMTHGQEDPLLDAVQKHADLIIKHGKDKWGKQKTELFVDGLHVDTYKPTIWLEKKEDRIISNFASQQIWMRTLAALSTVSKDPKYQQQANATIADAFKYVRSPDGMMYWGGHLAYDLDKDEPWGMWNNGHEFKSHYPWFHGLYAIDQAKTKQLMESIWISHMHDWRTMLFNRHGKITQPGKKPVNLKPKANWAYDYEADITLPIKQKGWQLSFINAASSLIYISIIHQQLSDEPELAQWGLRLAERYWAMRHPKTGIGGYQFNVRKDGDKAQKQFGKLLGDRAREWLLIAPLNARQVNFPLGLLLAADQLGKDTPLGKRYIDETIKEWLAYYQHAYDPKTNTWQAISTDGQALPYKKMNIAGYYNPVRWVPKPSNGLVLRLAATAYRLKPNAETRGALYSLLVGSGLAKGNDKRIKLNMTDQEVRNADVLYALLELDSVEKDSGALKLANNIATAMLKKNRVNGLFVPNDQSIWASINTPIPLAILHVVVRNKNINDPIPLPFPDSGFLHAPFRGVKSKNWGRTYDLYVFYNRTRAEPELKQDPSTGK